MPNRGQCPGTNHRRLRRVSSMLTPADRAIRGAYPRSTRTRRDPRDRTRARLGTLSRPWLVPGNRQVAGGRLHARDTFDTLLGASVSSASRARRAGDGHRVRLATSQPFVCFRAIASPAAERGLARSDEEDLPAQEARPEAGTRLPRPHGFEGRSARACPTTREGAQAAHRLTRTRRMWCLPSRCFGARRTSMLSGAGERPAPPACWCCARCAPKARRQEWG